MNENETYKIINHSGPGYNALYSVCNITMYIDGTEVGRINSTICDELNDDTEDEDSNHSYYFYIHDLFVEPKYRMKGYANKLIQKIKEFNKTNTRNGLQRNIPMVANCNDLSKSIFENNGFNLKEKLYIMEL